MLNCVRIKAFAGTARWVFLLCGALIMTVPAQAQTENATPSENHSQPKLIKPVSVPDEALETSPSVAETPEAAARPTVVANLPAAAAQPAQDTRPKPVGGNRVTQKTQGQRYGNPEFEGEPINLNVVDADIRDVLNYITEQYGVNFVVDRSVLSGSTAPKVTINVSNVPWNIVLDSLLRSNGLGAEVNGPVIRIATQTVLAEEAKQQQAEQERRKKLSDSRLDNLPLYTELIRLNYARPYGSLVNQSEGTAVFRGGVVDGSSSGGGGGSSNDGGILPIIQRRLSRRGSIEFDARTNMMIVTDIKENLDAMRQLVGLLDKPAPQVEIEARIVIANRNFSRDLGVQLAGLVFGRDGAAASIATIPGSASTGTGGSGGNTTGFRPGGIPVGVGLEPTRALGANLPSTIIGLTTGIFGTAQISAAISTAEQKGQAKVIASPRVTALNNRPAQIESGQQIPVVTPQSGGGGGAVVFTTTFVSVPLRLSVTPQITDAGTVILRIVAENNSVNTSVAINGTPGIDTQRMSSEVLVPDGGTTVVGGVLADNETEIQSRTPGVSSIPVIGNLFKRKQVSRQTNEILFFITPRIYRPDYQGNPIADSPKANGTNSTTISQPVPLGNPRSNSVPSAPDAPDTAKPEPGTTPATPASPAKP